jgi:hypothetical protein
MLTLEESHCSKKSSNDVGFSSSSFTVMRACGYPAYVYVVKVSWGSRGVYLDFLDIPAISHQEALGDSPFDSQTSVLYLALSLVYLVPSPNLVSLSRILYLSPT